MAQNRTRILVAGDLHIGRTSSRAPEGASAVPPARLRAVEGWRRIVETALELRADLLVLTGDIADESNRAWEALGPLREGIRRLSEAGIETVAVAGNHDYSALPRLADLLADDRARFRLLGRDQQWERWTLRRNGQSVLHLDGWSFAQRDVSESPLDAYDLPSVDDHAPIVGVVHGDLDVPSSRFAPLALTRLRALPPQAWLLGHIHRPQVIELEGSRFALYPGSPQALDFGETGVHGAWLIEVDGPAIGRPRLLPVSSVRYETLQIDLDGAADAGEIDRRVHEALRTLEESARDQGGGKLEGLSLRVELCGRTPAAQAAARQIETLRGYEGGGNPHVRIDRVDAAVHPPVDLEALARSGAPPGIVARMLLDAGSEVFGEEVNRLSQQMHTELMRMAAGDSVSSVDTDAAVRAAERDLLQRALWDVLEQLLAQEAES